MKSFLLLFLLTILLMDCQPESEPPCHGQAIQELIMPVYLTDAAQYAEHTRTRIRCAGNCPDGAPCDSIIELTNTSMGASVRRVKCGCRNEASAPDCGIVIEHTRASPDTTLTRFFCAHGSGCPVQSDTCMLQTQVLPNDTIRSRVSGRDSLIVKKWMSTCECMETERG